ncbi:28S ribosomal protein S18b, mitochondrial [Ischnura elegans]|uniref:28S ribosomal protein S18b, mitochondrial n=1 Tax=Ischnura elegans TaxID=197161 RepID=UPI001ED8936B|nr:28S ribosomal protein S18b, mitochondrial [Ischnura elegans]
MNIRSVPIYFVSRIIRDSINSRVVPTLDSGKELFRRTLSLSSTTRQESAEEGGEKKRDPTKDRTKVIPVETSIKYLRSAAYKETYGDDPVWVNYRRNYKGSYPPRHTRKTCVRQGAIATGNPCPICRDEYLVLDHANVDLLKQFVSAHNGEVLSYNETGLCRRKHQELLVAIERAKDRGLLTFDVPFREYDYSEYISKKTE